MGALGIILLGLISGAARAADKPVSLIPLPQVLIPQDADIYRKIFSLQSLGKIQLASGLMAQLSDRLLLGDVLSQRYLYTKYSASFRELQQWLAYYSDHREAPAIYRMALARQPHSAAALHRPVAMKVRQFSGDGLGTEYRSGPQALQSEWLAGLAAWRAGQFARAGKYFAAIAQSRSQNIAPWRKSAAAYWAARTALAQRQPQQVNRFLRLASHHPQTLYGVLAHRQLGRDLPFDWRLPRLDSAMVERVRSQPAVSRVVALAQVGQAERADRALQMLYNRSQPNDDHELLALAVRLRLPVSQMRMAKVANDTGRIWQSAFYPVPAWRPYGGFTAEPALLYAFMRQESKFIATAQSPSGARGLMQLMPATAGFIANNRALGGAKRNQLFNPQFNLTLGQRYIHHLLRQPGSKGDLFTMIAAYHAGPGNLEKWRKQMARGPRSNDPLLFIESIPIEDTRRYVERVVTDYWLYQDRLGQAAHTLEAVAAGQWPVLPRRAAPQANLRGKPASIDHDG